LDDDDDDDDDDVESPSFHLNESCWSEGTKKYITSLSKTLKV